MLLFGLGGGLLIGFFSRDRRNGKAYTQQFANSFIHHFLAYGFRTEGIEQSITKETLSRHFHIESCSDGINRTMGSTPIGNDYATEPPLFTENVVFQFVVLGAPTSIHLVVGCHHSEGTRFFHCLLEG